MKIHALFVIIFLYVCYAYANSGYIDTIPKGFIKNPFDFNVISLKEKVIFPDNIFEDIRRSDANAKNGTSYLSKIFENNSVARIQQEFNLEDGLKNTRNIYLNGKEVVCMDSISPNVMEIESLDNCDTFQALRYKKLFLGVFRLLSNIQSVKNASIISSDKDIVVNWKDGTFDHIAKIEKSTGLPISYELRNSKGELGKILKIKTTNKKSFQIICEIYNPNNLLFVKSEIQIDILQDDPMSRDIIPEKFGFIEVIDRRWNNTRKYIAIDKLPTREFLDDLFKNPDDVVRYNREMSRFAPIKCDHK